jgi:outer membrane cobalamin receptor
MFIKKQIYLVGYLIVGKLFFPGLSVLSAQEMADTTQMHLLNEVEIQAASLPASHKSGSPLQVLKADDWAGIGALQVSDAVKFFAGAQVKDYGGVGGLKTVSIRSLGAGYTNVAYDGIAVSDYQTGQTDLGRFSSNNVEMITLHTGVDDPIFQTAQMQSLAGTLNIVTRTLPPNEKKKTKPAASLKAGSFALLNPSLWIGQRINSVFSSNLSADYIRTDGNYPFWQTIGFDNQNTEKRIRNNSDVEALKLESNLTGRFESGGRISIKMYSCDSERGLPGAAIYYNDYSGERLKDRNFFTQARYEHPLHEKVDFLAHAKINFSRVDYVNEWSAGAKSESRYGQREYYLNTTFLYKFSEKASLSWANDGIYGDFTTSQPNFKDAFPSRTSWLSALSGKYETASFNLTVKLLNTFVKNEVRQGKRLNNYNHFSPCLSFSVKPLQTLPMRLRAFYKNTFRLPTFGDLYYSIQPTPNLKPENARQYNAGLTFAASGGTLFPLLSFTGDIYYYRIRDKIAAIPRGSMFIWSVQNYGKVAVKGFDLTVTAHIQTGSPFLWQITGSYTCQEALNKTAPESAAYNKRLPYTARHSASGIAGLKTPLVDLNYHLLYCGKRYSSEGNYAESQMKPFTEQGFSLLRTIRWKDSELTLTAECLNLSNVQYEIVNAYPMPGRSFRFSLKFIY